MMNSSASSASKATRRKVLALSSLGALGGVAAYMGWSQSGQAPQAPVAAVKAPVAKATVAPVEEVTTREEPAPVEGPKTFAREAFVPHVNSEFMVVHEGDDSAPCRLIEVGAESRITAPKQSYTSFSLLFEARPGFLREGGFCHLKHEKMGELQFFLSPVGKPGAKILLEAVFTLAI